MDGVLFRGGAKLQGADDFIRWLDDRNLSFMLTTNNSTLTPKENEARLKAMGIDVDSGKILTSSVATAMYLDEEGARASRAVIVGENGLRTALADAGVIETTSPTEADWVVMGLDRQVTYERLRLACLAVERGAKFVATNADSSLPVEDGLIPGAGALQAVVIATTGVEPTIIGKPEPRMLSLAMESLAAGPETTAVLGDRLDTDIEAAHRAGLRSVLVFTGVASEPEVETARVKPTVAMADLPTLMSRWDN
jgi:4-nitrophenyl phosphatase